MWTKVKAALAHTMFGCLVFYLLINFVAGLQVYLGFNYKDPCEPITYGHYVFPLARLACWMKEPVP